MTSDHEILLQQTQDELYRIDAILNSSLFSSGENEDNQKRELEDELSRMKDVVITATRHSEEVRTKICAALTSISGDSFTIAKTMLPTLVLLAHSGVLPTPEDLLVKYSLALMSITIGRMGVSALCNED